LLKAFVEAGHRLPDPRREEDFALHLRLIEAAFFGDREARFGLAGSGGVSPAGVGQRDSGRAGETPALPGLDDRVAEVKRLQPELYQAVYNMAEATWQRLQVFARQAEKEAKDLRQKLERAARATLRPGKKALKHLWWKVRDRRLAQNPGDAIYQLLWAKFLVALKKAKAERRKAEAKKRRAEARKQKAEAAGFGTRDSGFGEQASMATGSQSEAAESEIQNAKSKIEEPRKQKSEAKQGTGGGLQGTAAPDPKSRIPNCGAGIREQASIGKQQSTIRETRDPKPEPQVPDPGPGQSSIDNRQSAIRALVERLIGVFLCSWTYPAFEAATECNRRVEEAFRGLEGAVEAALARSDRKNGKGVIGKRQKRKGRKKKSRHLVIG